MIRGLKRLIGLLLLVAVGLVPFGTSADEKRFEGVENAMTPAEFKAAGLDKLSAEELQRLNSWLDAFESGKTPPHAPQSRKPAPAPVVQSTPAMPEPVQAPQATGDSPDDEAIARAGLHEKPAPPPEASSFVASVVPHFEGWSGKTVFELDNGQVWQQRQAGSFAYLGTSDQVRLTKKLFGFWFLEHLDSGRSIGVKRIH
ncbi:MAG: hypothetical protein KDI19_08585 [Pseudomonadales bacterium]|nr:hypothetical protein [Pseudomonadales bacterium]